ncbi:hypothetical protein C9374_007398 [Naegleria lovaniensis]|uniref:FHA domain-containing protein n=1 Tax=Naegleria lovaniensis TaxID=51637 RepID=A0AA88KLT3_NAELO|nr:uncharacterized protein C9374_007398 [Naegleria lovaniensis]KAG2379259.1 hypothetical protein C9374_007398 [Naegleria lovaniensis]
MVRTRSSLSKVATQEQSKTASSSRRHITTNNNHHDNNGENQTSASQSRGKTNSTSDEHDYVFKPSASSLVNTNVRNSECSKDGSVNSENQKHDELETTKPLKRVSFSSSVADEEEKESPNSALRKRKQRDIAKLIISPAEPIGHIIVYSNVKQSVRPDSMTLWIDPMGSRDTLTALKFGSNPVTTNIQIKRAVNRKWPIFPEHCTLTHDGNSTVLLLEKEAMVVVNGQYYKNSRTAEKNVICVDKVIIDYGDIIDLDGRLFIYVKHNLPSYFASYQQMFMNYVENKNMKRKREDEGDDENESAVKKEKLLLYSQEDETTTEDTDEEQDLDEEEQIDSEELQNVISEMGDEEIEDYGHLNDLDLETDDMTLQTEDNNIPCFVSSPQKDNDDKILDEANPIQSQEDGDLEHIIGADLYQEIIEKLNVEVFKQMEEKEKEFMKKIEHLEKALKEEKERASQHSHQLEKQIETLKNNLKDREEEIEEHKRALEKSKLQIEKNDAKEKTMKNSNSKPQTWKKSCKKKSMLKKLF